MGAKTSLAFLSVAGEWLGIAMKSVTSDKETHVNLLAGNVTRDGSLAGDDLRVMIQFDDSVQDPNRITVHFRRDWDHGIRPLMAACRVNDRDQHSGAIVSGKPFGFACQEREHRDQHPQENKQFNFLNLVYQSPDKLNGFEPLYLKLQYPDGKSQEVRYLKISVTKENGRFIVTAASVSVNDTPDPLQNLNLKKLSRDDDTTAELARSFAGLR